VDTIKHIQYTLQYTVCHNCVLLKLYFLKKVVKMITNRG